MTYVGVAQVPLSSQLAIETTMSWPRIAQEMELDAYSRGVDDGAEDREEIRAEGWVEGASRTARALGEPLPAEILVLAQKISDRISLSEEAIRSAYDRGWREGQSALVDVQRELGHQVPNSRAFELGRQVERRRWERINGGELS